MTPAQRARLRTVPYLFRALIPLALLVLVVIVIAWPRGTDNGGVHPIDPNPVISQAREQAPYQLLAPVASGVGALPAGWQATSARIDDASAPDPADSLELASGVYQLRVGYVTPNKDYAQFEESNDAQEAVLSESGPRTPGDPVKVGSDTWQSGTYSDNGETLLFRSVGDVTVIVTGSASLDELKTLAAALVAA
jgi:hypothetical protein